MKSASKYLHPSSADVLFIDLKIADETLRFFYFKEFFDLSGQSMCHLHPSLFTDNDWCGWEPRRGAKSRVLLPAVGSGGGLSLLLLQGIPFFYPLPLLFIFLWSHASGTVYLQVFCITEKKKNTLACQKYYDTLAVNIWSIGSLNVYFWPHQRCCWWPLCFNTAEHSDLRLLRFPGPAEAPGVGAGPRHQEHLNHPQNDLMCWWRPTARMQCSKWISQFSGKFIGTLMGTSSTITCDFPTRFNPHYRS